MNKKTFDEQLKRAFKAGLNAAYSAIGKGGPFPLSYVDEETAFEKWRSML